MYELPSFFFFFFFLMRKVTLLCSSILLKFNYTLTSLNMSLTAYYFLYLIERRSERLFDCFTALVSGEKILLPSNTGLGPVCSFSTRVTLAGVSFESLLGRLLRLPSVRH